MDKLLTIKNLCLSIKSTDKEILKNINFDISNSEIVSLIGESGSGKSLTALSIIRLLEKSCIIKSGEKLMKIWGDSPFEFIQNYESGRSTHFVHRTFNSIDFDFFCRSLKNIYTQGGLESAFGLKDNQSKRLMNRIINFRCQFLSTDH